MTAPERGYDLERIQRAWDQYCASAEAGSRPPWERGVLRAHYEARADLSKSLHVALPSMLADLRLLREAIDSGATHDAIDCLESRAQECDRLATPEGCDDLGLTMLRGKAASCRAAARALRALHEGT